MATEIPCPVKFEDRLYDGESENAIASNITPFDDASIGELVAVSLPFQLNTKSKVPVKVGSPHFYLKTDTGTQGQSYRSLRLMFPQIAQAAADLALCINDDSLLPIVCQSTINDMDPADGENFYTEVILTDSAILVTVDDVSFAVECNEDGYVDSDNVSNFISMILPKMESAHAKMEWAGRVDSTMNFVAALIELLDEDEEPIHITAPNMAA